MPDWRELRVEGLGPIERVAAVFQISPPLERLPFVSFKVKVIERVNGTFLAVSNVTPRGTDGQPDYMSGLGDSVEEALEDFLRRFVRQIDELQPHRESDFVWSDPSEF